MSYILLFIHIMHFCSRQCRYYGSRLLATASTAAPAGSCPSTRCLQNAVFSFLLLHGDHLKLTWTIWIVLQSNSSARALATANHSSRSLQRHKWAGSCLLLRFFVTELPSYVLHVESERQAPRRSPVELITQASSRKTQ